MESLELEGDPLIALRRAANDYQDTIRRELDRRIYLEDHFAIVERGYQEMLRHQQARYQQLEDQYTALEDQFTASNVRNNHLTRTRQQAYDDLGLALTATNLLERQRDLARRQRDTLRAGQDATQEENYPMQPQQDDDDDAMFEQERLQDRIHELEDAEARLRAELDMARRHADRLQTSQEELEAQLEGLEMQRDHYQTSRAQERQHNQELQEQIRTLTAQNAAVRALLLQSPLIPPAVTPPRQGSVSPLPALPPPVIQPPSTQPSVNAAPLTQSPPTVHTPDGPAAPAVAPTRGTARGGRRGRARGRAGRGGRGAAPAQVSRQHLGRQSKVNKNYRQ